jgi:hypothetical protein
VAPHRSREALEARHTRAVGRRRVVGRSLRAAAADSLLAVEDSRPVEGVDTPLAADSPEVEGSLLAVGSHLGVDTQPAEDSRLVEDSRLAEGSRLAGDSLPAEDNLPAVDSRLEGGSLLGEEDSLGRTATGASLMLSADA